jgi:ABC-type glutathione transport system ATPase component
MMDVLFLQLLTSLPQTSALDTYTEQALLQNINSIIKEKARTSVFVAHRLRTIYDSDQILVLKDGHVVESGTHAQLLEMKGLYAELWHGECSFFHSKARSSGSNSMNSPRVVPRSGRRSRKKSPS